MNDQLNPTNIFNKTMETIQNLTESQNESGDGCSQIQPPKYVYKPESMLNINTNIAHYISGTKSKFVCICCYHINTEGRYPFIQFLLEKSPSIKVYARDGEPDSLTHIVPEEFIMPIIEISEKLTTPMIIDKVTEHLKYILTSVCWHSESEDADIYKGTLINGNVFMMYNISNIKIENAVFTKSSKYWFGLSTELINSRVICNIKVNDILSSFLIDNGLYVVHCADGNREYPVPDALYSGSHSETAKMQNMFGKLKTNTRFGHHWCFVLTFDDAVKFGAWTETGAPEILHDVKISTDKGVYYHGAVNRYAIFLDDIKYMKTGDIMLPVDGNHPFGIKLFEPTYDSAYFHVEDATNEPKTYLFIKSYEQQIPLSMHFINNSEEKLGESWSSNKTYEIF